MPLDLGARPPRPLRVCIAGVTGRVGRGLAAAIAAAPDLSLTGAVSRRAAGRSLGEVLGADAGIAADVPIAGTVAEALAAGADVFVDFTSAASVGAHVHIALEAGAHVVIGSSGLTDAAYDAIDAVARERGRGAFAAGNFALTAVLLAHFASIAARHVPDWEIVDYGPGSKKDAPSGTARELAFRLASARAATPPTALPAVESLGEPAARGAALGGTPVHSVRLPGVLSSIEVVFGLPGERLSLRHDSVDPTTPYVAGAVLAIRRVPTLVGLTRGLDRLLGL